GRLEELSLFINRARTLATQALSKGWATIYVVSVWPFPGLEARASPTAFAKLELGNEGKI
ncbi:MAG: hypothetical protein WD607_11015, partial [Candidatus Paceibacterota bacterium]